MTVLFFFSINETKMHYTYKIGKNEKKKSFKTYKFDIVKIILKLLNIIRNTENLAAKVDKSNCNRLLGRNQQL